MKTEKMSFKLKRGIRFASNCRLKDPTPKIPLPDLKINEKWRATLPKKNAYELEALEADMLFYGCQKPIEITPDGIIIDGHYRYEICKKYNIPFKTIVLGE